MEICDGISVVTPTESHYSIAKIAIKDFNCHVFIEKPITETTVQADELIKSAKAKNKIIQVLDRMEENIPAHVIPIQSEDLHYQIARIYGDLEEKEAMRSILETLVNHPNGRPLNRVEYANTFFKELDDTEKSLQILEGMRSDYLRKESMLKTRGFSKKTVKKGIIPL